MVNSPENGLTRGAGYKQEQRVILLLERLAAGSASKYPRPYDYIGVTSFNGAGDPLIIQYKLGGSGGTLQFTHTITYDGSGNFATLTIS